MRRNIVLACAAMVVFGSGMRAHALINPNFTPVHLLRSSDIVLLIKVDAPDDKNHCRAQVLESLVPKKAVKDQSFVLDLTYMREHQLPHFKKILEAHGDAPVMLFSGKGEDEEEKGFLQILGQWIELEKGEKEGVWEALSLDARSGAEGSMGMDATWAGGTDMLIKVVKLLLEHPDLDVPSTGGTGWENHVKIDNIPGKIHLMLSVDTACNGENALFVGAEQGDRLYVWNKEKQTFANVAAERGLSSKTQVAAWGDFSGNGRLDLASWDGKGLTLWTQGEDEKFSATPVKEGLPAEACVSLQALEVGVKGKAGLLWGLANGVALVIPDAQAPGVFTSRTLEADSDAVKAMGRAAQALAGDLTGNGMPDIIVVGEMGGLFFEGKAAGAFEKGRACPVSGGEKTAGAFFGDWNADGLLDVFTVSRKLMGRLWQNEGKGAFVEMLGLSGEIAYISKPGSIAGNTCDINNDGRQDIFLAYHRDVGPMVFFNRFYRSFGHAHQPVDIVELGVLPDVIKGQQAGVLADFTHDGAQDMAFAMNNGDIYVFIRDPYHGSRLVVTVALPAKAAHAGPVRVWGDNGTFPLGAWSVLPGVSEAFLGMEDPGEITVHWQFPGQKPRKAVHLVEDKPVRMVLSMDD